MKKILKQLLFSSLLIINNNSFAQGACSSIDFGTNVHLKETTLSGITPFIYHFDILGENQKSLGKIKNKLFKLKSVMQLRDSSSNLIATAKAKYISWGTHISFYDCNNQLIGKVIEDSVLQRTISLGSSQKYTFFDSGKNAIGSISKLDLNATKFIPLVNYFFKGIGLFRSGSFKVSAVNPNGVETTQASAKRTFAQGFSDEWSVKFNPKFSQLKKLMFLFLPTYRTRVDSVLKPQSSIKLNSKKKLYNKLFSNQ